MIFPQCVSDICGQHSRMVTIVTHYLCHYHLNRNLTFQLRNNSKYHKKPFFHSFTYLDALYRDVMAYFYEKLLYYWISSGPLNEVDLEKILLNISWWLQNKYLFFPYLINVFTYTDLTQEQRKEIHWMKMYLSLSFNQW